MAYNKKTWLARLGQGLNKFIFNGGSKVTLDSAPDVVSQQGTPLSAENMNDLEQRIKSGFDDVDSAINAISDIIGNLGWNQLVDNFHYTSLVAGVNNISGHPISYKQGHKYLICQKGMTIGYFQSDSAFPVGIAGSDTGGGWHGAIGTAPSNANSTPFVSSPSAQTGYFYFNIFDLTAIFGAGNEPSTVAEFRSLFPADYYPYTEGYATKEDVSAIIHTEERSLGGRIIGPDGYTDISDYLPIPPTGKSLRFCTVKSFGTTTGGVFVTNDGLRLAGAPNTAITATNITYFYW